MFSEHRPDAQARSIGSANDVFPQRGDNSGTGGTDRLDSIGGPDEDKGAV